MGSRRIHIKLLVARLAACLMVALIWMLPQMTYSYASRTVVDDHECCPPVPTEEEEVKTADAIPFLGTAIDARMNVPEKDEVYHPEVAACCVFHGDVPHQPPKA